MPRDALEVLTSCWAPAARRLLPRYSLCARAPASCAWPQTCLFSAATLCGLPMRCLNNLVSGLRRSIRPRHIIDTSNARSEEPHLSPLPCRKTADDSLDFYDLHRPKTWKHQLMFLVASGAMPAPVLRWFAPSEMPTLASCHCITTSLACEIGARHTGYPLVAQGPW